MIIAIDGPAGSGKSTTARRVADHLGFLHLDTGAMYRAVAALLMKRAVVPESPDVGPLVLSWDVRITLDDGMRVWVDGEDMTSVIRDPAVGEAASRISQVPAVRSRMVEVQRRTARSLSAAGGGVVVEGRDIGTVVFPEADLKVFMDASIEVRAARRQAELAGKGHHLPLEQVRDEMVERDLQDRSRAVAPLVEAPDAWRLDTSELDIEDQVDKIVQRARRLMDGSSEPIGR